MYIANYLSPLGKIILASNGYALTGTWFEGQKYFPDLSNSVFKQLPVFEESFQWLDNYFLGKKTHKLPILHLEGTPFRLLVWKLLQNVPYGTTMTYGELAYHTALIMNKTKISAQCIGNAVGHNPISIFIPCHRIIGSNGSLIGYAGGITRKQILLNLEQTHTTIADVLSVSCQDAVLK